MKYVVITMYILFTIGKVTTLLSKIAGKLLKAKLIMVTAGKILGSPSPKSGFQNMCELPIAKLFELRGIKYKFPHSIKWDVKNNILKKNITIPKRIRIVKIPNALKW